MLEPEHKSTLLEARELINEICESLNLGKPEERINITNLFTNLIEKGDLWEKPEKLDIMHSAAFQVIQDIHDKMYPEEEEYEDLEDYFNESLSEIEIKARCKCGHEFETWIPYWGVEAREERAMGPESTHYWSNEMSCPKCGDSLEIGLNLWEYPMGAINNVDFESNCEILNKDEIYHKIGIVPT